MQAPPAVTLDDLYDDLWERWPPPADRPFVAVGMVASVDGRITVDGGSAGLGADGDRAAFRAVRAAADAILVGAGTVRAERYGPPSVSDEDRARRRRRGQPSSPSLVVVTTSGDLDPEAALFSDRATVVAAPVGAPLGRLEGSVTTLRTGADDVDLSALLRLLRDRGVERLVCEGGPTLIRQLLEADLVDELVLTIAPLLVGGQPTSIVGPSGDELARRLALTSVLRHGDELLLRYRVRGAE